ncbi:MAG: MFS transporter [Eggerthellales bacterium]|nr:MFS transporter [Eggerthellales bacterium]
MSAQDEALKPARSTVKLWSAAFALVITANFLTYVIANTLNTGSSVYVVRIGYTSAYAGIIAMVFSAAGAVTRLIIGPIMDKGHTTAVMKVGVLILIAGAGLTLVSQSTAAIVIARALQGFGFSAAVTAIATACAQVLPKERLGEGISLNGVGMAITSALGPAFGLYLVDTNPPSNLFTGCLAVGVACVAVVMLINYEKHPEKLVPTCAYRQKMEAKNSGQSDADGTFDDPEYAAILAKIEASRGIKKKLLTVFEPKALAGALPQLIMTPAFGFVIFFLGLYAEEINAGSAGVFFMLSAAVTLCIRLFSGPLMDRVAPIKLLLPAMLCGVLGFTLLLAANFEPLLMYAAAIPYGVCTGFYMPVNQSVAVKNSSIHRYGAATSLFLLAYDLGIGTFSVVWGLVNDAFGYNVTIVCCIICIVTSYFVARATFPKRH